MNDNILVGDALTYQYPDAVKPALIQASVNLPAGEMTAFIGPNGSGKSTLLHCLTGGLTPTSGDVWYAKRRLQTISPRERAQHIALVQQSNQDSPMLTVREIVQLGRTPFRHFLQSWSKQDEQAFMDALGTVGLADLPDRPYRALSGGQQQRVWLALALAQEPQIIFLDEPTTFLDIHYQLALLRTLRRLSRTRGLTVGLILHDLNQVLQFADNTYCVNAGQIVAGGTTATVVTPELVHNVFQVQAEIVQTKQQAVLALR